MTTKRSDLQTRWGTLKSERASWWAHWQELSRFLMPRSGRFFVQDRNKGYRRHNAIYDSTGLKAKDVLAAGFMAGATSPARPWARLIASDEALNEYAPVREWLSTTTKLMLHIFQRSNIYRALHSLYEEEGVFGTAAAIILDDFDDVIRMHSLTIGEYALAADARGNVDTLYREFQMTVAQMVKEFGLDVCSPAVQNLYKTPGGLDQWITIIHAIEPRADRDISKRDAKNMAWRSCYFELSSEEDKYLREGGFPHFPAVAPRWATAGGDIYGNGPGMLALGDVKQLQHQQMAKARAIDYKINPPLQVPTALKNRDVETLPGGISFYDPSASREGIRSAFEVNLDLQHLLFDIQDVRQRIKDAFFEDLFLALANNQDQRMTATEVAMRHEEKLLMLGPVLERQHNELLDPLVELTIERMFKAGIVSPPPPEMHGQSIGVEFISMLAQAQRAVATNSIDRFVLNLGQIAQFKPDVLDKLDADKWADEYSDMLGVDPSLIVPSDKVALIRKTRQQAQQAAQQAQALQSTAQTAQHLASADTSGKNALTDVMSMFSGYSTPQVTPTGA